MSHLTRSMSLLALAALPLSACADLGDDASVGVAEESLIVSVGDVGWAWASKPAEDSYDAVDGWAYQTRPGDVRITRQGVGRYRVTFEELTSIRGNPQVSAFGENANRCKIAQWQSLGAGISVDVRCNAPGGALVDSKFDIYYAESRNIDGAYVWSGFLDGTHTANSNYSYNSTGQDNVIERTEVGRYTVLLKGLNHGTGHAMVTAYGTDAHHCKPTYWDRTGGDTRVHVRCFDTEGNRADSRFTLRYVLDSVGFYRLGYAWLSEPTDASYTPSSTFSRNSERATNTVRRTARGNYTVHFPKLQQPGATVITSAYESDSDYCKVDSFDEDAAGDGTDVEINCYDKDGQAVDTKASVLMVTGLPPCRTECDPDTGLCGRICA